ncbi:MAG: phosphogluconate dehydrogenase (NAD(+)-dependent, decarboxylating) [Patescibacteria group bacterium]
MAPSKRKNIAYIGLGKMGFNMVSRLLTKKYRVSVYDTDKQAMRRIKKLGGNPVSSLQKLTEVTKSPRLLWIMVPHGVVASVLKELKPHLRKGDALVDGGNSPYWKSEERARIFKKKGVHFLDVGVSGGPSGAKDGASLMIGGEKGVFKKYEFLFKDLAVKNGYAHLGPSGAGHFVKMIHNGIEYGMMQSLSEGFAVMKKSKFQLDLREVARIYNRGSVIESRLVGWLENAFKEYGSSLKPFSGSVAQSGEGLWTVRAAEKLKVPVPIIKESLRFRLRSKNKPNYTSQILSALRNQFGGHTPIKK